MINRGKYSEAMKLTKLFNMPFEGEICEAQVRDIIGQLNYWNTSLSANSENVSNLWNVRVCIFIRVEKLWGFRGYSYSFP